MTLDKHPSLPSSGAARCWEAAPSPSRVPAGSSLCGPAASVALCSVGGGRGHGGAWLDRRVPLLRSRSAFSSGKLRGTATGLSASHYTQESSPAPATPAWGERWVPELWVPTQLCPQGHFSGRVRDGFLWCGSWAPPSSPVHCPRCRRVGWAPRQRAQGHRAVTVSGGCGRAQRLSVSACKPIPE